MFVRNMVRNFFFPKTNNLHYLAAFTIVIFFVTKFFKGVYADNPSQPQQLWMAVAYAYFIIAMLASQAFLKTKTGTKEKRQLADSYRMAVIGAVVGMFSWIAISSDIDSLDSGTFNFYSFFGVIALYNVIKSVFRVSQIYLVRGIKDRSVFKRGSALRRFFDLLARNYDSAYDNRIPTRSGALSVILLTLTAGGAVSAWPVEQTHQPLLAYIAVSSALEIIQSKTSFVLLSD